MPAKANPEKRLKQLAAQIRVCVECPLWQSRTLAVPGDGPPAARYMMIGEGPARTRIRPATRSSVRLGATWIMSSKEVA